MSRSLPITKEQAISIVHKNCRYYTRKSQSIYRGLGMQTDAFALLVQPSKYERESANTANYYTLLIDNSPKWINYPKRSKSIVCSTSYDTARGYGMTTCYVIPFRSANIGICSESDIWEFFHDGLDELKIDTLDSLNALLLSSYGALSDAKLVKNKRLSEMPEKFFAQLKEFDKPKCKEFISQKYSRQVSLSAWTHSGKTLTDYLFEALDPITNLFTRRKIENFKVTSADKSGREVWTDSDSLLIPENNITAFWKAAKL